ncbi:MAG: uncharacterized protein QOF85_2028 [Solirubrobacterales bacterium]|jgi:uncharacterized membrane protein (UPF0127 family)|nr:uncharacterized protein [Solirubrobacterales bacterium]
MEEIALRFTRLQRQRLLDRDVAVAAGFLPRLLGLSHLDRVDAGEGLLIPGCRSVHTFGMRFDLDLYFLDGEGTVVALRLAVPPRRFAFCARARSVLEVPAGQGGETSALSS